MIDAFVNRDLGAAMETLLAVSLLILLVLLIRRPVARHFGAGIAYLLWALPFARLILPPLPTQASLFSLAGPGLAGMTGRETQEPAPYVLHGESGAPGLDAFGAGHLSWTEAPLAADPLSGTGAAIAALLPAGLGLVWGVIALCLIVRGLFAHRQFMRLVADEAIPAPPHLVAFAEEGARRCGLRRTPPVVLSLISSSPFVTGLLRPVIVLPAWFDAEYNTCEARSALAHELTHVRRGDLWALQVANIFVASLWFNPLAYLAASAFRTDQESACDADVLRDGHASPHAYGTTLVKAARAHRIERPVLAHSLPLTHALKERLTRMSYPVPSFNRRVAGFGLTALVSIGGLLGTASLANAGENADGRSEETEIRIENGALWLDGAPVDDRQIILLSDPMAGIVPPSPDVPGIEELQFEIEKDIAELTGPDVLGPEIDISEDARWEEIGELAGRVAEFHSESTSEDGKVHVIRTRIRDGSPASEAEAAALEAELDAKVAALEAEIAARSAEGAEERARIIELRIDAHAAEIERRVEAHFGADFEDRVAAASHAIEDAVSACASAELAKGETRLIERAVPEGTPARVICVDGDRARLTAADTLAMIDGHPDLSAEEKAAFRAEADAAAKRKRVMIFRTGPEAPEAPDAPAPPEVPAPPAPPAD